MVDGFTVRYAKVVIPFVIAAVAALANSGCSMGMPLSISSSTTDMQTFSDWPGGGALEN